MTRVLLRRLSAEEVDASFNERKSTVDLTEFTDALRELSPGDGAEVEPDGLTLRTSRRRMNTAARQLGFILTWGKRGSGFDTHFVVREVGSRKRKKTTNGVAESTEATTDHSGVPVPKPTRRKRNSK